MNEPRQIASHVAEGDVLVQAIYNYKVRTGLWPETISASECPAGAGPTCSWHYQWLGYDWPPILTMSPAMHSAATYRFPGREFLANGSETPNWSISGDSRSTTIVSSTASWQPTRESAEDIDIRKIAELRRRLASPVVDLESRRKACRAVVSLHVAIGKHNEAEQILTCYASDFPADDPWPRQAAEDLRYHASDAVEVAPDLYDETVE
jgi:hypothetical protein